MSSVLQTILIITSMFASLCSGLVLWNLRQLSGRVAAVEKDNKDMFKQFAACKKDCERNFVAKEDWLREAGYNRAQLEEQSKTLNRIEGKLAVTEKLPEICGSITKEVISKLNGAKL